MGSKADQGYYLIMNPGSGGGASKALFAEIHRQMILYRINYEYVVTTCLNDAEEYSRQAARAGFDVIVAVGGDGTINRVLNGFYHDDGTLISDARLGVIYTGTSPDFCRSYGIPVRDPERAVAVLAAAKVRTIGIGRICFADRTNRFFACCANIGLGAGLAEAANGGIRERIGDKAGTFLSLVRMLAGYRPAELTVNGIRMPHVYNLSVGKTYYIASGLKIKHRMPLAKDEFYTLCIRRRPVTHIIRLYTGGRLPLQYRKKLMIKGNAGVECDGDPCGRLPVVIKTAASIEVIYEGT